ncbi:MAG: hypothetical protein U5K69_06010 [Balneolaceae bacterium]|nr:hypothetical protein [Balneolaceae bacterium]
MRARPNGWPKPEAGRSGGPEDTPRLVVTDAGHDAAENLLLFSETSDTDFLVKGNLRRQDPAEWLAEAQPANRAPGPAGSRGPRLVWRDAPRRSVETDSRRGPPNSPAGGLAGHQAFCRLRWPAVDGTRD